MYILALSEKNRGKKTRLELVRSVFLYCLLVLCSKNVFLPSREDFQQNLFNIFFGKHTGLNILVMKIARNILTKPPLSYNFLMHSFLNLYFFV